jgi:hypothetical protein
MKPKYNEHKMKRKNFFGGGKGEERGLQQQKDKTKT